MSRTSLAALAFVVLSPFAASAAAQEAAAPAERFLTQGGTLYARLLDIPPFVFGEMPRSRPTVLPALYVSFIGLEVFDGYSTSRGLAGGAVEANPLVRWSVDHPATLWAVKGAAAAGSIYFAERLWKRNRRAQAVTVMLISNVVMGFVAARNVSAIHATK